LIFLYYLLYHLKDNFSDLFAPSHVFTFRSLLTRPAPISRGRE